MSFPPISPDSLDGSRMRLNVYIKCSATSQCRAEIILSVHMLLYLTHFLSARRIVAPFASFLPLFCWIGNPSGASKKRFDLRIQLGTVFFFFFKNSLYHSLLIFFFFLRKFKFRCWRVWIIASLLQSVEWHKNSFEIPVHAVHYVAQTWTLGDVTAWQTRVARAARVTSIRVFLMPNALSNVLLKL